MNYKPDYLKKISPQEKAIKYFENVATSGSFTAANKFLNKYILTEEISKDDLVHTPENIKKLKDFIEPMVKRLHPKASTDEVVEELIHSGIITEPVKVKKEKQEVVEVVENNFVKLSGLNKVELEEEQMKILEANLLDEALKKENVFKNPQELDLLLERTKFIDRENNLKDFEYYNQFAAAGLIEGGQGEVIEDFQKVQDLKQLFINQKNENESQQKKLEQAKKIATLTERGFAYGVSELNWYGKNVKINISSEFDDYKRGVDGFMEIIKPKQESDFIGLGIDVTFRGLESEEFEYKFFKLLISIRDGYKTKIKYGKDYAGNLLKEFAAPEVIVFFDIQDVKDIVFMLQNIDNEEIQEKLKDSPQKVRAMKQIFYQCKILADFAQDCENSIFRKYTETMNALKELSWSNEEIKEMIQVDENDPVIKKINELITEFSKLEKPLVK